jgi:hypothetical protein
MCKCHYCHSNMAHPEPQKYGAHKVFARISDVLKVPNSKKESDRVQMESCNTCGHTRERKS